MSIVPHASIEDQIRLAVLSERLGYDSCWWPDHMAYTDEAAAIDSWTVMAVVASKTRRLLLGTAVSDPHRMHPAVFAQRAATLDQLSKGRLIVGLGSGEAMNLDAFGIPWKDRRVGRMREFIQVFRGLLDSPEPFTHRGPLYQLDRARLSVRPYQNRKIPVQMASLGPQMQKLAGEVADGWKPVVIPAQHYAHYFEGIRQAAVAAGRDPNLIERGLPFAVALVDRGPQPSAEQVATAVRPYAGALVWDAAIRQMGLPWDPPTHLVGVDYHTVNPFDPDSLKLFREYADWLSPQLLRQFVVVGDQRVIRQAVRDYVEAGVNHFEITNASLDPVASIIWFAAEVMPEFTGRPPTMWARALNLLVQPLSKLGLTRRLIPQDLDVWKKVGL
ncbi:LLM class flavin-dependent oxidoreductase [bacterium]|nr:LLM class flavin-dependent oxidoreductase [bacterium]